MASSMSLRKIWPMPARRSGNSSQKSFSHRLWAWMPARRCSYSSGLGGRANSTKLGKNGGHRVREDHLADDPVGLLLAVAHLVVPVAQAPVVAGARSLYGFLYLSRQASKSSRYVGSRYSR